MTRRGQCRNVSLSKTLQSSTYRTKPFQGNLSFPSSCLSVLCRTHDLQRYGGNFLMMQRKHIIIGRPESTILDLCISPQQSNEIYSTKSIKQCFIERVNYYSITHPFNFETYQCLLGMTYNEGMGKQLYILNKAFQNL